MKKRILAIGAALLAAGALYLSKGHKEPQSLQYTAPPVERVQVEQEYVDAGIRAPDSSLGFVVKESEERKPVVDESEVAGSKAYFAKIREREEDELTDLFEGNFTLKYETYEEAEEAVTECLTQLLPGKVRCEYGQEKDETFLFYEEEGKERRKVIGRDLSNGSEEYGQCNLSQLHYVLDEKVRQKPGFNRGVVECTKDSPIHRVRFDRELRLNRSRDSQRIKLLAKAVHQVPEGSEEHDVILGEIERFGTYEGSPFTYRQPIVDHLVEQGQDHRAIHLLGFHFREGDKSVKDELIDLIEKNLGDQRVTEVVHSLIKHKFAGDERTFRLFGKFCEKQPLFCEQKGIEDRDWDEL